MARSGDTWTIKAALDWTVGYLERKGDESPRLSAEWLLSEATGLRRIELYVNFDRPLSMPERDVLRDYVARRGAGEPLQYITGEVGFRHIPMKVRKGVLIPRPETEVLVSEVLALLPAARRRRSAEYLLETAEDAARSDEDAAESLGAVGCDAAGFDGGMRVTAGSDAAGGGKGLPHGEGVLGGEGVPGSPALDGVRVADICTGSGCIACSLAHEHPGVSVVATDISPGAVALARENADALGLSDRIEVIECDLGMGIDAALRGCFDAVVSNPPYIPTAVMRDIPREVADYEPALALDGGEDGLDVFRRLLAWAASALKSEGFAAFELHETCLDAAADYARNAGWRNVRIVYDLTDRPRVLTAHAPAHRNGAGWE